MTSTSSIVAIPGIGPAVAKKYNLLGITTVGDLLHYYPRRYDDYSSLISCHDLRPGPVTIAVHIEAVSGRYVRRGMHVTEAVGRDDSGSVKLLWFNQPFRAVNIKAETTYFVSGHYELSHQRFSIINPSLELASDFPVNTARILAIYRETKGLSSKAIRQTIKRLVSVIAEIAETLPNWLIEQHALMSLPEALQAIHMPVSADQLQAAQERLGFEEVFRLTLASLINKQAEKKENALKISFQVDLAKRFVSELPFRLTNDQRIVCWRIFKDLERTEPMNRLVEGDVGAGKTVVAAMAAVMALQQGFQVALMAPTEILANQHHQTITKLLRPLGFEKEIGLLVGSLKPKAKQAVQAKIADGSVRFVIGTHALITDKVAMPHLALVIIDEQHRFGVEQRKALQAKAGTMPHVLSLTATPIPRSLALTLYGELDISILAEKPPGRQPIITKIISPNSVKPLYANLEAELKLGRQVFIVCPLITDSETIDVESAESLYERLSKTEFKSWRLGLLHGKLKPAEKQSIMQAYVDHHIDLLIATTVIEVGVDVPNATIMVVAGAERFGLAQIHQLRGRIGRGEQQGYCYLLLSDSKPPSRRLRALESSNDGFSLAELDLQIRGPGAIYGGSQHGQLDLRIAQLTDIKLIARARSSAEDFLARKENLLHYRELASQVARLRAVTNLN